MEDGETLRTRIRLAGSAPSRAAGCSRSTVQTGARDLESGAGHDPSSGRVRRPGEEALRWLKVVQILGIGRKNARMRIAYPVS